MEKKRYYITMNTELLGIREEKIPDMHLIQHEIEATEDELEELKKMLIETKDEDMVISDFFLHPLNEGFAEHDRNDFEEDFQKLHEMIYQLGTPETKRKLENQIRNE
ncbi:hypothetical protein ACJ2A9_04520 [Anaerobacillus sp. MEB173]|uniref:hypothetical protein n=1 Tax=Anaerobacillus sp. MEB173 TaxID=3383345 RepID=UPI003F8EAC60